MAVNSSEDDTINKILGDRQRFVKRLGLPADQHHLYDDIIQDTMIVVHGKLASLKDLDPQERTGWVCNAMFNVTRNTRRKELRRTQAWQRLAETAFEIVEVREYFDRSDGNQIDVLLVALKSLNSLDRQLLVNRI
jgi:DNA-directed RNA polymerase specialized sigma24 family protein